MCMSDGGIGNPTGAWIPRDQVYTQIEIDDHFLFYAHQAGGLKLYNKFSSIIIVVAVDLIANINAIWDWLWTSDNNVYSMQKF